ncbi:hypothetical protein MHM88_08060 [Epibacterium sp. MM17-32]|uniref:hypothetical protein n=1 Tax=Epibacterium sp. MM17-32 TaxID=2917734 RepID=UPI001EF4183A|nr:hypothetical protein [Epibacterium sp. MM17-32]MCG7627755.1 hypothetical protein [Epibacterium sp. MM17-32]
MATGDNDPSFDLDVIQSLIKKGKAGGGPFPFAFGLAAKPEACGFLPHLRKPVKALKSELKSSSPAIKKVCVGTFTVEEGQLRLSCEKPIKGIIRQLRVRFRKAGLGKFKPVLVGPDGQEIDEDSLPDDDGAEERPPADHTASDTATADAAAPSEDGGATLKAQLVSLNARLKEAPEDQRAKMAKVLQLAVGKLKAGDMATAQKAADQLAAALDRNGAETARETGDTAAPGAPLDIWIAAKDTVDGQIGQLQSALRGIRHPAFDRIADLGLAGLSGGTMNTTLMAALYDYRDAPASRQEDSRTALRAAVGTYRAFLHSDPVVAHCENNPFGVRLTLIETLGGALGRIESELKT